MKHTPGPWKADYNGTLGHIKAIINDGERATPTVAKYNAITLCVPEEEQKANGALIAAAPELLEALKNIENDDNRIPKTIWDMRNKAIAKAEGV